MHNICLWDGTKLALKGLKHIFNISTECLSGYSACFICEHLDLGNLILKKPVVLVA